MATSDWLGALLQAVGQGGSTYFGMKQLEKDRAIEAEERAQAKADRDRQFAMQDRAFKQSQDQFDYGRAKDIYASSTPDQNFADSPDTLALLMKAGLPVNKGLAHTPGKATGPMALPTGQSVGLSAPPPPIGKQNDEFAPPPGPTPPPAGPMMSPVGGTTLGSVKDTATRPKTVQELAMEELQKAFGGTGDGPPNRMLTALTAKRAGVTLPTDRVPQRLGIVPDSSFASGYALVTKDPDTGEEERIEAAAPASAGPSSSDVDFARRASAVLDRTVKPGEELAPADLKRVYSTDFTPPRQSGGASTPGGLSTRDRVDYQQALTRLGGRPETKDYQEMGRYLGSIDTAMTEAKTSGTLIAVDQALINAFNKLNDPTSVVRESEYARTANDQALLSRIRGRWDKITTGGAGLTPVEREAIARMARAFHTAAEARAGAATEDVARQYDAIITADGATTLGDMIRRQARSGGGNTAASGMVDMIAPDGRELSVPAAEVEAMKAKGARVK